MFIIRIPPYVYQHKQRYFPALPYSYTFLAIFICMFLYSVLHYTNLFLSFFFFRNIIDTCVMVSIDVIVPFQISLSSDSFCISTLYSLYPPSSGLESK